MRDCLRVLRPVIRSRYLLLASLYGLSILSPPMLRGQIINHENDDNLARAMEHDRVLAKDKDKIDQSAAEQYYLKYLERATDKNLRAKVFFQLGYIYSTGAAPNSKDVRNLDKAKKYFESALREDSNGICQELLFTRTHLASLSEDGEIRIRLNQEVYKYLAALDGNAVSERYVSPGPPEKVPTTMEAATNPVMEAARSAAATNRENGVRRLTDMVTGLKSITAGNIVADATSCSVPEARLGEIAKSFPGDDELGKLARAKLKEIEKAREAARAGAVIDRLDKMPSPPAKSDTGSPPEANSATGKQGASSGPMTSQPDRLLPLLMVLGAGLLCITVGLIAWRRRSSRMQGQRRVAQRV